MSVVKVNIDNYDEISSSDKTVLLDFYADWCGPCKMVSPIIDQIAEENPEYLVGKVNVDEESELAGRFGVMSIPTLVVLRNGEAVSKTTGARPKAQILALLKG
jgi:thioredoxin 1